MRDQAELIMGPDWTELTNADVTEISFQALTGAVFVRKGTGAKPNAVLRGWYYAESSGERKLALTDLAAGTGARVWARAARLSENPRVLVDHA